MKKYLSRLLSALLALVLLTAPAAALTVDQALELLEASYYYDIPDEAYQAGSLEELFDLLGDPYTGYMTEEQYAAFLDLVEDTVDMVGIGVSIQFTEQGILILSPLPGGSAEEAELQAGDLIVAVDGAPCVPAGEEAQQRLLGQEGTQVTVTVLRDGETRDYTLQRRAVYIPNTRITLLEGGVGYVDCDSFGMDTGELFAQGLQAYDSQVDCWVVDLRDNAGGYVDSAADMLAALSGPGRYIYFAEKDGQTAVYARDGQAVTQKPLFLLVNGSSASASEAVAAGVRDTGRGLIIGGRTFGKGVGQSVLDEVSLPEYFDGDCLKLTTGRIYSYSGTTTHQIGVIPTLLVDDDRVDAVAAALQGGKEDDPLLCLVIDGDIYYVDPGADQETLAALLEALPPQAFLFYNAGVFNQVSPSYAANRLGISYDSRWFSDVADSPYSHAINALGAYRLLSGTGGSRFNPRGQLTRAQLCVMLSRVFHVSSSGPSRFSDVPQDSWYGPAVNAIAELGLMRGVGGGRFDPEGPVTQEQLLTVLGHAARYLSLPLDAYGAAVEQYASHLPLDMRIMLAPYASWARDGVAVLTWGLEDVLGGSGNLLYTPLGRIDPAAPVLREEAAAGIYALLSGLEILP